jgi:hypothetical protein
MENIEEQANKDFKNVGDEGLFPNHSDKDIWLNGYLSRAESKYNEIEKLKHTLEYVTKLNEKYPYFQSNIIELNGRINVLKLKIALENLEYDDATEEELAKERIKSYESFFKFL